ncbi:hypothetical protein G7046_g6699 [Stylonectria norvegica]|nr:hypothetical protein G7046_g6699 [Stylonectria norvegica]
MDHKGIAAYFEERSWVLRSQSPLHQKKSLFSFDAPHTCGACEGEVLELSNADMSTYCFECFWRGIGELSPDGRHRLCGKCGTPYEATEVRDCSLVLSRNLGEAIIASKAGCALYEWLVDSLVAVTPQDLPEDLRFYLASRTYSSATDDENVTADFDVRFGTVDKTHGHDLGTLRGWTTASNEAAKYISSRPYEHDMTSSRSIEFARHCFQICRESHPRCAPRFTDKYDRESRLDGFKMEKENVDVSEIPSRLLDLDTSNGSSQVKLVETKEMSSVELSGISSSGFSALSYCWGGPQEFSLSKTSHRHLKNGFETSELPQTLQDAVWAVEKLGLRYLWIDSLCVFQDNNEDKQQEIARMASYYGGAVVTICAAAASRVVQGFLSPRETPSYQVGPFRLALRSKGVDKGHMYLLQEIPAEVEPTTLRGWTLQESLLSRRILIFAKRQLYWCCVNSYAGCGGLYVKLVNRVLGNDESLVENIHPLGAMLDRRTFDQWHILVREYTKRTIGYPGDKLLAISAIAAKIFSICQDRGEEPVYLAGVLIHVKERDAWFRQLLWFPESDLTKSQRSSVYRAPSWSWAALDGPVDTYGNSNFTDYTPLMELATVEAHHIQLSNDTAPFGAVLEGHLILQARRQAVTDYIELPLALRIVIDKNSDEFNNDTAERLELFPDTLEDEKVVAQTVAGKASPGTKLFLIELGWKGWTPSVRIGETASIGLLVATVPNASAETYRRVGIYRILRGQNAADVATTLGPARFDANRLFANGGKVPIRII